MLRTVEAEIDQQGQVRLLESVNLPGTCRALVTIMEPQATVAASETALLSESALGEDWNRPEEEAAWSHLQQVQSS